MGMLQGRDGAEKLAGGPQVGRSDSPSSTSQGNGLTNNYQWQIDLVDLSHAIDDDTIFLPCINVLSKLHGWCP